VGTSCAAATLANTVGDGLIPLLFLLPSLTISTFLALQVPAVRPVQDFSSRFRVGVVCTKNSSAACHNLLQQFDAKRTKRTQNGENNGIPEAQTIGRGAT
jgi:hypothetical protein